jgi:hypothetical protein
MTQDAAVDRYDSETRSMSSTSTNLPEQLLQPIFNVGLGGVGVGYRLDDTRGGILDITTELSPFLLACPEFLDGNINPRSN